MTAARRVRPDLAAVGQEPTMSDPWLSVIVPTYNGAAYLAHALDSIAGQRDEHMEVIAIDDGSADTTPQILRGYARWLPLRIFHRRVGNWVANTNYGLSSAGGVPVAPRIADRAGPGRRDAAANPGGADAAPGAVAGQQPRQVAASRTGGTSVAGSESQPGGLRPRLRTELALAGPAFSGAGA